MKKAIATLLGAAVLAMTTIGNHPAWAGLFVDNPQVTIIPIGAKGGAAYGSMGGARYSNDSFQSIGCSQTSSTGLPYVYCSAMDRTQQFISCTSFDLSVLYSLGAMTDTSYLYFKVGTDGTCTNITVGNNSSFLR